MDHRNNFADLVELFRKFPGIGQRQAERFTRHVIHANAGYIQRLTGTIQALRETVKRCPQCFIHHELSTEICETCAGAPTETLVIVEKDADASALISSGPSQMRYFILGGLIPIHSNNPDGVRLPQLKHAIRDRQPKEIILAFSVHPDAEHTIRYLKTAIHGEFPDVTITTLGRGLSTGSELEYSDPETLANALRKRDTL